MSWLLTAGCCPILILDKNCRPVCGEIFFGAFLSYSVPFATNGLPIPASTQTVCNHIECIDITDPKQYS